MRAARGRCALRQPRRCHAHAVRRPLRRSHFRSLKVIKCWSEPTRRPLHPVLRPCPCPIPAGTRNASLPTSAPPAAPPYPAIAQSGGYQALQQALAGEPAELVALIADSQLAGRGGAGFPTGQKWQAVAEAPGEPKTVVCNADEGEPGCFKDRALLEWDPHAVIEGMLLAAYATGATRRLYLPALRIPGNQRHPRQRTGRGPRRQPDRRTHSRQRLLLCTPHPPRRWRRTSAARKVPCSTASKANTLTRAIARPIPVTHGFEDLPTAVNNVETLASVHPRSCGEVQRGIARWASTDTRAPRSSVSSGDVQRPGNYEVPFGLPLNTLLHEWAGGPGPGRQIQAVTMAGISGGFLAAATTSTSPSTNRQIRARGSMLGAGGIMAFDDRRDIVDIARQAMAFFAEESCGKCFPCRIGTQRLTERLGGEGPADLAAWRSEVEDIGDVMKSTSACGLGMAAPFITDSLLKYFPDQVAQRVCA